ncbi:MAG: aminotransferase class IV [Bacteroidetes bacterium]|nr:aminotransferase class IV [Bacteroidota bacterium]
MYRLLETIKVLNRKLCNVEYHNTRMNNARRDLFNSKDSINLNEIVVPEEVSNEVYKCRVIYSENIIAIDFQPYVKKSVRTLKVVHDDGISYAYKYEDRSKILRHLSSADADEILIVKNGLITDTSYSNVVFSDGKNYLTPATPLLKGTKRAKLIDDKIIYEDEIRLGDLHKFKFVYLINAMLDLDETDRISCSRIVV